MIPSSRRRCQKRVGPLHGRHFYHFTAPNRTARLFPIDRCPAATISSLGIKGQLRLAGVAGGPSALMYGQGIRHLSRPEVFIYIECSGRRQRLGNNDANADEDSTQPDHSYGPSRISRTRSTATFCITWVRPPGHWTSTVVARSCAASPNRTSFSLEEAYPTLVAAWL
jgi:hypothetical protein